MRKRWLVFMFYLITLFLFGMKPAFADSALKALGDANEKFYQAAKSAPPGTSRQKLKQMSDEIYREANQKAKAEMERRSGAFVGFANQIEKEIEKELEETEKNPKLAQELKDQAEDGPDGDGGLNITANVPSGGAQTPQNNTRVPGSSTTGSFEGVSGAKSVDYEKLQKKKPVIVDGIIQER